MKYLIQVDMNIGRRYESFIMVLAALLNGVAGIMIDLYAPCLPTIAREFQISSVIVQNTISASVIGYAFGQILFGILCDWRGRKFSIVLGLILLTLASLCAAFAHSIEILLLARIVQGCAVGSCQVVARAMLVDVVKGPRFMIAVVYLSAAFALGLIIGPYIGAEIQQWLSWRWNFLVYAIYSLILLGLVLSSMRESLLSEYVKLPFTTLASYKQILSNTLSLSSFIQLGCCFIAFTLWNQIGPFIVEHELGQDSIYFGLIALSAGVFYLFGTLLNRILIYRTQLKGRLKLSSFIFFAGIILLLGGNNFHLIFLLPGLMLITFAQGIAFPNILSQAMSIFPEKAGASASIQGAGMLIIGSIGLGLVSFLTIKSSIMMGCIYAILLIISLIARFYSNNLR